MKHLELVEITVPEIGAGIAKDRMRVIASGCVASRLVEQ
ncbi:hypothetical protein FrEUN1fDRAFT_6581 [Parafrankia sp. EUN1f]|nr:hypothetical protein FrEUN1fDRAFT_6581 [Parafrankia sp. EUN1f]